MPRVKISEYKAKELIYKFLGEKYSGVPLENENSDKIEELDDSRSYVIKVDQGIKKRNKLGLIGINVKKSEIPEIVKSYSEKGFSRFLLEEFIPHEPSEEKFMALERTRQGIKCFYSLKGGINIEENKDEINEALITQESSEKIAKDLGLDLEQVQGLINAFENLYLSFLETNPFLVTNGKIILIDLAVEVDSAADFFVNGQWVKDDIAEVSSHKTPEESEIKKLADQSSASFKLVVLNPEGSIFTIFSGGGASIVLADEINNKGNGHELANYAEYSGGPSEDETYIFTKNILSLALKSEAKNKKIYVAGGVANFTDIRATFKGIIKALGEKKEELKHQGIKVYVRRGGPFQEEGLSMMKNFLESAGLLGEVMGPDRVLTEVITSN